MMSVLISSKGSAWSFHAVAGDKVFLVETVIPPEGMEADALGDLLRECRWMFGDRRVIYLNRDDDWIEILHDGTGRIVAFERYDGPVPEFTPWEDEEA